MTDHGKAIIFRKYFKKKIKLTLADAMELMLDDVISISLLFAIRFKLADGMCLIHFKLTSAPSSQNELL